jgi:hypothetical protein
MATNQLIVQTPKGPVHLDLTDGGYCVEDGRLTLAIETNYTVDETPISELDDDDDENDGGIWPYTGSLAIANMPVDGGALAIGQTYYLHGGMLHNDIFDPDAPAAYGYFTFHVESVEISVTIRDVHSDQIVVDLKAATEDVDSYDEDAKDSNMAGTFELKARPLAELWIPT